MSQWYCAVEGRRYGPISEDELRQWIAEGRIRPNDYVWTEGMADWTPAGSVPGLFGPGTRAGLGDRTLVPAPGGTGGTLGVGQILSRAWATLKGRWGIAIGFSLLLLLLQMAGNMLPYVGGLVSLLLSGAWSLGAAIFFLTYIRGGPVELGMLFAGFRHFGTALGAYLLIVLFTTLWGLLGALPGGLLAIPAAIAKSEELGVVAAVVGGLGFMIMVVWANLRYSQTFFLLADTPSLGALGALRGSIDIMRGNKLRLLGLGLTCFLLTLACMVVICVGWVVALIFAGPFFGVCYAIFHDDLHPPRRQPTDQSALPEGPVPSAPTPEQ